MSKRIYTNNPILPWAVVKCAALCRFLLMKIIATAVVKKINAVPFSIPWVIAPTYFCSGVWVGWSNKTEFVVKSNAAEFKNCRDC